MSLELIESRSPMNVTGQTLDADIRAVCERARRCARAAHSRGDARFREARGHFLALLLRECFREAFREPRMTCADIRARLGFGMPLLDTLESSDRSEVDLPTVSAWDPELVGWAFQVWQESERERSSWGVSYAACESAERADVAALTQIFTDGYIADFLVRATFSTLSLPQGRSVRVCDPGCGAGHLLLRALRLFAREKDSTPFEVYGFDIEPVAVELCRSLLLVEHIRLDLSQDPYEVWKRLDARIAVLDEPRGILDREARLPASSFDMIVANPPYLGRRKMPGALRDYVDANYPAAKIDLCAAFLQRCVELLADGGGVGFVASDKWLRLRGYQAFRGGNDVYRGFLRQVALEEIVELGSRAFSRRFKMHDGVSVAVITGRKNSPSDSHTARYRDLSEAISHEAKRRALGALESGVGREVTFSQRTLISDGLESPFMRVSDLPTRLSDCRDRVSDFAQVVVGLQTNDDRRFVRYVWEVPPDRERWRVHSKGGGYSRWYGLNHWILDWRDGRHHFFKTQESLERAEAWSAKSGWCYGWFANGCLGLRVKEAGWTFGRAATSGVFCEDLALIAFLNSRWASLCVRQIGGKMQIPEGVVRRIPAPRLEATVSRQLVEMAVELKKRIVALDPRDVLFQARVAVSWRDEYILQTLLLLVEGALEAQVEGALGISSAQSEYFRDRYGVPAAWLGKVTGDAREMFWSVVPSEFSCIRELISSEKVINAIARPSTRALSASDVRDALRQRVSASSDPWPLPMSSTIERLSRLWGTHPIQAVVALQHAAEFNEDVRDLLNEPELSRDVLVKLLRRLDHRWWSDVALEPRVSGASLSLDEAIQVVAQSRFATKRVLSKRERTEEWLRGPFSQWHNRLFRQLSPLHDSVCGVGGGFYSHRWDDMARSAAA